MAVLQGYIFYRVVVQGDDAGVEISQRLLIQSLALSVLNLAKAWWDVYKTARDAGVSIATHLGSQLQMGVGLPLDAFRKDAIPEWQCAYDQLADVERHKRVDERRVEAASLRRRTEQHSCAARVRLGSVTSL